MSRARRGQAEWKQLVTAFEASGLSAEAFAARQGVGASTLRWWRSRLRSRSGSRPEQSLVPFVRVESAPAVSRPVAGAGGGTALELPGGLVVRFAPEASAEHVSAVVAGTVLRLEYGRASC